MVSNAEQRWVPAWRRSFATEDETDLFYSSVEAAFAEGVSHWIDIERIDANTVELLAHVHPVELVAQLVEKSYTAVEDRTKCQCSHAFSLHTRSEGTEYPDELGCEVCRCQEFDRADWPPELLNQLMRGHK